MSLDSIVLDSGLEKFLQCCKHYDFIDSAIAVLDKSANLLYQNESFDLINHSLKISKSTIHLTTLLTEEREITSLVDECFSSSSKQQEKYILYYQLNAPVEVSLVFKPVFLASNNHCIAVMLMIAEENINYNKKFLARLQNDKETLAARIRTLSRENIDKDNLLRSLLHDTPFAIMLLDTNRQVIQINKACEQMLDMSPRQLMGQSCDQYFYCYQKHNACPIIDNKKTVDMRDTPGLFAGEDIILLRSAVLLTQANEPIILEAFIDITEKKHIEQELKQHQQKLEKQVAERTRDLRVSNRELESYSSAIAHDLRGPLRAIVSFSQIVVEEASERLDASELEMLTRITKSAKRMAHNIDSILKISTVSRVKIEPKRVNLSEITQACISHSGQIKQAKTIEWHIANDIYAVGDPTLLFQLLDNLITNAIKYSSTMNPAIIEFGKTGKDGLPVYYVKDNGIGFEMYAANKIFFPFQRLHNDTEIEGSGIGLATVQRIIDRHGGKVWAESEPNKGTTVFFTLAR